MIDQIGFGVSDFARSKAFYETALKPLGINLLMAFDVPGGGAPGVRPHYHPCYYGAFVLDPDGNTIEAVCHQPE